MITDSWSESNILIKCPKTVSGKNSNYTSFYWVDFAHPTPHFPICRVECSVKCKRPILKGIVCCTLDSLGAAWWHIYLSNQQTAAGVSCLLPQIKNTELIPLTMPHAFGYFEWETGSFLRLMSLRRRTPLLALMMLSKMHSRIKLMSLPPDNGNRMALGSTEPAVPNA